jgi:hypothetical protein
VWGLCTTMSRTKVIVHCPVPSTHCLSSGKRTALCGDTTRAYYRAFIAASCEHFLNSNYISTRCGECSLLVMYLSVTERTK